MYLNFIESKMTHHIDEMGFVFDRFLSTVCQTELGTNLQNGVISV